MFKPIGRFLFINTRMGQILAKNTFWLFLSEILSRIFRMVLIIFAIRILGKEGWGLFSYTLSLVAIFMTFADIGLSTLATREASQENVLKNEYLSTVFYFKLFLLIATFFTIIIFAPFFIKLSGAQQLVPVIALLLFFDSLREFLFALNRATQKIEREGLVKIGTNALIVGFGFYFLITSPSPLHFAWAYLLGSMLGTFWLMILIRKVFKKLWLHFSKEKIKVVWQSAWPVLVVGLFGDIMLNIDTVMLGWWHTFGEIGLYTAAQRLILLAYMIPGIFALTLFPLFAQLVSTNKKKFTLLLEKSMIWLFLFGLPVVAGGMIFRQEIILLVFGQGYAEASTVFALLLLTILVIFPNIVLVQGIYAYNLQKKFITPTVVGLLLNIIFNIVLIPRVGIEAVAVTTFISQSIIVSWNWIKFNKINSFVVFPFMRKIALALVLMSLLAIILQNIGIYFILNIALSAIFYFGALYVLKEPILKDLQTILKPNSPISNI